MTTLEKLAKLRVRMDKRHLLVNLEAARAARWAGRRLPGPQVSPRVLQAQRRNAIFHQLHDVILGHPAVASPEGVRLIERHLGLGRVSTYKPRGRCLCPGCPACNTYGRGSCARRPKVLGPCRTCYEARREAPQSHEEVAA